MDLERARINDEKLFAAVGRLTVTWAHLEFGLDAMIAVIHGLMDGRLHEKKLPRQLSKKLKYLRKAFDRIGVAEADRPRYDKFLDDVEAASVTRHDIIHGFPIHHASDTGEAKLIRLNIGTEKWGEHREVVITVASVMAAVDIAQKLAGKSSNWAKTMVNHYERIVGPIPV
jgi:hypothetical protein